MHLFELMVWVVITADFWAVGFGFDVCGCYLVLVFFGVGIGFVVVDFASLFVGYACRFVVWSL